MAFMNKEPLLDYVRRSLEANKGRVREISKELGLPYSTVTKIWKGDTPNPGVQTVQTLADYFVGVHASHSDARARKTEYSVVPNMNGDAPQ
jgi:hypothetical protein